MALDPSDYEEFRDAVTQDVNGYGFAPFLENGADNAIAGLMEWVRDGATPCPLNGIAGPAQTINSGFVTAEDLAEAITLADYSAATNVQRQYVDMVMRLPRINLDPGSGQRAALATIFGSGTTTRANINAAAQRFCSFAEQLFGRDTHVTPGDVALAFAAVRSVPAQ